MLSSVLLVSALIAGPLTPAQTKTVQRLEGKLMAPCCYSQTIDVHMSQEAVDMREEVTEMVAAGRSEADIIRYYKTKYGETILVVPDGTTGLVAYTVPIFVTVLGVVGLGFLLRRMQHSAGALVAAQTVDLPQQNLEMIRRIRDELGDI